MNEDTKQNISLPASVRRGLEQATQLQNQGRTNEANLVLQEMAKNVALSQPELAALLIAGQMGYEGFTLTDSTRDFNDKVVAKKFLGVTYAKDTDRTETTRTVTKTFRLF